MKDFSSILWVVIIVGAMIFNTVAKARRGRGKGGDTPPQHGEAWPSIPWDNDGEADPATTKGPETGRVREVVSREPATRRTAAAGKGMTRSENETRAGQMGQTGQTGQAGQAERAGQGQGQQASQRAGQAGQANMPKQPVFADFPDECKRLEVITPQTHETKRKRSRTTSPEVIGAESDAQQVAERHAGAKKNEATGGPGRISPTGPAEEPEAAEIAEEFDLRRAVIYSEILKPKFEE